MARSEQSAVVVALLLLFVLVVLQLTAEPFVYIASYGALGHQPGQFKKPESMAFSRDGRFLAVSDTHNNRVQLFSVDQEPSATQPLKLEMIYGDIWPWDDRQEPLDSADAYREYDYLSGQNTNYLAGRAYHGGQNRIRPAEMIPMNHFNLPRGIVWLDNETILVADTDNHRIKAMALNGEVKWILGREGWKDGYFRYPLGIDVDCDGNLYVTEPQSRYLRGVSLDLFQKFRVQGNRLQIFNEELEPSGRKGHMHQRSGRNYGRFKDLTRVWVDADSQIYLADNRQNRVLVFDSELNMINELKKWPHYRLRNPNGIDGSRDGRLAIADTENHRIVILDQDRDIAQVLGGFGTPVGKMIRPYEARFGPNGHLYVLDTGNNRIQIFTGKFMIQFPRCPEPEAPAPIQTEPLEELLPPPTPEPAGKDSF